ncbi:hypothetical protein POVWA2_027480 [Plasmodium ovale wallikeri]|uniref:Uncharacterized protein n=1 Tax=Plasmodium ovale wallikeri TaxID=864142 RepID=A0A1A8YW59_PLAOA|nr:hypothetical protein POVWA2_027480 [Plasmodium ovale wallikeri]
MHLQNYIIVLSRKRSGHFTCSALRPVNNVSTAQLSSGALRTSHVALPTGTYACLHTRTTQTSAAEQSGTQRDSVGLSGAELSAEQKKSNPPIFTSNERSHAMRKKSKISFSKSPCPCNFTRIEERRQLRWAPIAVGSNCGDLFPPTANHTSLYLQKGYFLTIEK